MSTKELLSEQLEQQRKEMEKLQKVYFESRNKFAVLEHEYNEYLQRERAKTPQEIESFLNGLLRKVVGTNPQVYITVSYLADTTEEVGITLFIFKNGKKEIIGAYENNIYTDENEWKELIQTMLQEEIIPNLLWK